MWERYAWYGAVADRGEQISADVGAESPRGPLKANEVGHIVKSVARWVWERYGADVPPLLREARIAAQREEGLLKIHVPPELEGRFVGTSLERKWAA